MLESSVERKRGEAGSTLGARLLPGGRCSFGVWAPFAEHLELELSGSGAGTRRLPLERDQRGIHRALVEGVEAGSEYFFVFADGRLRPDPRSLSQPQGVHGPSAVVDRDRISALARSPSSPPRPALKDWVIYEVHVGTFTEAGTFDAVAAQLPYLVELGVNAIELMPVSPFPGSRNWGYDGVAAYGVQVSYGGPEGLARLVRAAHEHGLALILDVVYNHLGPEGNYLREFGPYFTERHQTPWGDALNFDGEGSEQVRAWAIESALQWIELFAFDALRLDAVHAIYDDSPQHVVAELAAAVQAAGGKTIGESDMNDAMVLRSRPDGWGLDAQWSDDLHHALHALLTGERTGYYIDYGAASDVARSLENGFIYDGSRRSVFRKKMYGKPAGDIGLDRHVVCLQNHDQVGNRARGDRISHLVGLEAAKVGAAVLLLAPETPMIFMGEEYAAPQPFPFFTSHGDPQLARDVTRGRRHEFAAFQWQGEVPDPQAPSTFESAVLHLEEREQGQHAGMLAWYQALLRLRREQPALRSRERRDIQTWAFDEAAALVLQRGAEGSARIALLANFSAETQRLQTPLAEGTSWALLLDSGAEHFSGAGGRAPQLLQGGAALELPPHTAWVVEEAS